MRAVARLRAFGDRHPLLGPLLYVSSIQYFLVQFLVSLRWSPAYSLSRDTISDLGNTACGRFNGRPVCSPLHSLMNLSFVALGVTMIVGSVLLQHALRKTRGSTIAFASMAIGGLGVVMVGIFPENSISALHGIGSSLPFLIGNAGVVVASCSLRMPLWLRVYSLATGAVALAFLAMYASNRFLGLGEGGMERVVAYPQTTWLIVFGVSQLISRPMEEKNVSP
jgi:hypothetical membrane protein